MQFVNFGKNKQSTQGFSLDSAPLKKIVAVSDAYWTALYQPVIKVVTVNLSVFVKQKNRLRDDYVDQFVSLVRRSKGGGQDDPLLVHIHTYCLVVSFSALYLAGLMRQFDFFSISSNKKTPGERNKIYPWLEIQITSKIKIRKISKVYPVAAYAFPILNSMISSTGWLWLHGSPLLMQSMFDAVYSNSASGPFIDLLGMIHEAPLENDRQSVVQNKPIINSPDKLISVPGDKQQLTNNDDDGSLLDRPVISSSDTALDELQSFLSSTDSTKKKKPQG